ncbi:terminase gpP N-terminus-related DNA-binding protein [Paenibacillus tianmuensis]|uniref:terminase gpP N-terminus-related DNA-binding protein n=1 Tax=Paenibacillus tianmuensis TaxID=624147 RepID=UPI00115FEE63|nr:hypothetical protein [Paenibacillus tianmuensis]
MFERYQALYLHLQGTSAEAIAPILDRSAKTVKGYAYAYCLLSFVKMNIFLSTRSWIIGIPWIFYYIRFFLS